MRPICVICTDIFVINSSISACNCGHIFHEDCLNKWIKSSTSSNSNNQTCPQCRAKISHSTIIKRLYLTEADLSSSQLSCSNFNLSDISNNEVVSKKYEELLNYCEDLKNNLRDKSGQLDSKAKSIEQKDKKIKELDETASSNRKRLNENQILIDYLKKELENYNKMKDQYESREKKITELELKLREFKSIDLIYKEHQNEFENEMKKYLTIPSSVNQMSVIRQLVSTNVLLKEQLDKQTEDKKILRKKLMSVEKIQSDKEKFLAKKQQDIEELKNKCSNLELKLSELKDSKKISESPLLIIDATIEDEEKFQSKSNTPLTQKNSEEFNYLSKERKFETNSNRKKEINHDKNIQIDEIVLSDNDSISSAQIIEINANKRKNPFKKSDSFPRNNQINLNSEDDDEEKLISPPSKITASNNFNFSRLIGKDSPDIAMVKPIKPFTKMKSSALILSNNDNKLNEKSILIKPLPVNSNYQYDGLGGRKKVFKSSSNLASAKTTSSLSKLTKSKVT